MKYPFIIATQTTWLSGLDDEGRPTGFRRAADQERELSTKFYWADESGNIDRTKPCDSDGKLINESESTR